MIGPLINVILYLIVLGLLFWLVMYLLQLFPLPEPFPRVIQAVFAIVCVLIVISVLFGADVGLPLFRGRYP